MPNLVSALPTALHFRLLHSHMTHRIFLRVTVGYWPEIGHIPRFVPRTRISTFPVVDSTTYTSHARYHHCFFLPSPSDPSGRVSNEYNVIICIPQAGRRVPRSLADSDRRVNRRRYCGQLWHDLCSAIRETVSFSSLLPPSFFWDCFLLCRYWNI